VELPSDWNLPLIHQLRFHLGEASDVSSACHGKAYLLVVAYLRRYNLDDIAEQQVMMSTKNERTSDEEKKDEESKSKTRIDRFNRKDAVGLRRMGTSYDDDFIRLLGNRDHGVLYLCRQPIR